MNEDQILIDRQELFDPAVDQALARERAGRERIVADVAPVSPLRRFLLNSLVYLPFAAVLAALVTWILLEPNIHDRWTVRGDILLINAAPDPAPTGWIALTIGSNQVLVAPLVRLDRGIAGEPAFAGVNSLKIGDRVEVAVAEDESIVVALAIRPAASAAPSPDVDHPSWPLFVLFPLTAMLIAFGLMLAEGLTTRNWLRMTERALLGSFLAAVFATLAFLPAGLLMELAQAVFQSQLSSPVKFVPTMKDIGAADFILITACRSAAWACIGATAGLGMNLVRSTRAQRRNTMIGGAMGGAFGGMFFDPIDRFFVSIYSDLALSRLIGLLAVGLSIGIFVALVERLARDAWLRVRTGPLAGKSFILYKTPTIIGSSPQSDVYLYKDAEIDQSHASIHRVGTLYEIEDMGSRMGTTVGGGRIHRHRLISGDQIVIGSTILDFEERQSRTPVA